MSKHSDGCPDSGHTYERGCDNSMYGHGESPCSLNNCSGCSKCEGKGCFPASTLIETPDGKVRIADVEEGRFVLSWNNGVLIPRRVSRKLSYQPARITEVVVRRRHEPTRNGKPQLLLAVGMEET